MPRTIEITMTPAGFDVLTGERVARFRHLDDAVRFAQEHFTRAEHIREMKARIG